MRLRTYNAPNLTEAMALVRRDLGSDAVIVSTGDARGGGVEVRAAAEGPRQGDVREAPRLKSAQRPVASGEPAEASERILAALGFHRAPEHAAEALARAAGAYDDAMAPAALAQALEARYGFRPIEPVPALPLLFAGAPGAGKTSALAKIAARAVAEGGQPLLVCADPERAGAEARLRTLASKLQLPCEAVDDPRDLERLVTASETGSILIDAPASNPFDLEDLDMVTAFAAAAEAEILPVIEAGIAPEDADDVAAMFGAIGARRVILTKLDTSRRQGAIIGVGEAGLAYAQISASPYIGSALAPATPLRISRALLDERELPEDLSVMEDEA
ncbi:flagellar biosynthesis protein FlhF [Hyphobacterium marinum]|uniref:Flagellar biosynthesis-like protein (FlhF) n=1 Tax=Hyphobacterium marinum TaxID=3116574 RepID=A0ABU7LXC2_9PROT|nr:flagellar biosynthesis-like protein (FlhF) [Hyphobacterium sp. Y6023]MEE2566203.1 flagellar biosynthesis-like protein (FlhF) [Hyphobacterium sp. Y6023]